MKLYHVDRSLSLQENQVLNISNNFKIDNQEFQKCLELSGSFIEDGLSSHGIHYFLNNGVGNGVMSLSDVMDIIFEYERQLNYSDKLSRYKAFYALDKDGVKKFIEKYNLQDTFYKIYEVESDYYESHNMTLISGSSHYTISAMAKCYWENLPDPFNREPLTEYLLKYPIRTKNEVRLEDIV